MAAISVTNIKVLDNPAKFFDPFKFEITFECLQELPNDIEWKVTYVGRAEDTKFDQVLDTVLIGPLQNGMMRFTFEVPSPDISKIPKDDIIGITAVILSCSYLENEFFRVGYYVNNSYEDPELMENPPAVPDLTQIQRQILSDKPRITRFQINWEQEAAVASTTSTPLSQASS
jgi:histone chaperone ASF1